MEIKSKEFLVKYTSTYKSLYLTMGNRMVLINEEIKHILLNADIIELAEKDKVVVNLYSFITDTKHFRSL